jgi:hypothetical protein
MSTGGGTIPTIGGDTLDVTGAVTPAAPPTAPTSALATVQTFAQSVALDLAGLGLLAAAAYCAVAGKSAAVYTPMFTLGGTYLGYKLTN